MKNKTIYIFIVTLVILAGSVLYPIRGLAHNELTTTDSIILADAGGGGSGNAGGGGSGNAGGGGSGNAGGLATSDLNGLVRGLISLLNNIIFLVAGLALITFIWGITRYLYKGGDAKERENWRKYMIYGVIALTVISGIWGIVNGFLNFFGINGSVGPQFPEVETE